MRRSRALIIVAVGGGDYAATRVESLVGFDTMCARILRRKDPIPGKLREDVGSDVEVDYEVFIFSSEADRRAAMTLAESALGHARDHDREKHAKVYIRPLSPEELDSWESATQN